MRFRSLLLIVPLLLAVAGVAPAQGEARIDYTSQGHHQIVFDTAGRSVDVHRTKHVVADLAVRPVPASAFVSVTWSELRPEGRVPHYAISQDGGTTFHEARATSYDLKLRYATFDPSGGAPAVPTHLDANQGGRMWIVQYWTQGLPAHRDDLRSRGATIFGHLWNHANIVEMDPALAASVTALPYVRAVVAYHPAFRLDSQLLTEQIQGFAAQDPKRVNVVALRRGYVGQRPIAARIQSLGGQVVRLDEHTWTMWATMSLQQIAAVARMDEVQWIEVEAPGRDTPDLDIVRQFHGADYVLNVGGYDGTGVRGEISDTGVQTSHPEFSNNGVIPHGGLGSGSHGTSVCGIVFGQGANPQARGVCFMGQAIGNSAGSWAGGSEYNHTTQLSNPSLSFQAVLQTFSGFSPLTTSYTSDSQTTDLILFDNSRMTMTHSQSNQNSQLSRARAWGKNCVAIGGIAHLNSLTETDDNHTSASFGPAADGRVKPELASFYDSTFTATTTSNYTTSFGGTSGATPITAGHFGLFYHMWHNGEFQNPTGSSVFDSRPQNTTARAFMISSASQWDFVNGSPANSDIDRDRQGWGRANVQTLYDHRNNLFYVDETDVLPPLGSTTHAVTVTPGQSIFKATLVWRDNPGTMSSSQHLINDMNLRVTAPGGVQYWGNNGMTNNASGSGGEALWTSPGGSPDTTNSVENVFVQNPTSGVWLVEVIAANINQDNHVETAALDCDYSLCVIGGTGAPPTFFDLQLSTTGNGDLTIDVNNVPAGANQGWCLFSEDTSGFVGGGSVFGLYPTFTTLISLTSPPAPGNLFHWTWPVSGIFPDTGLAFPNGSIPASFFPLDGVAIAVDPGFTQVDVTSVRRAQ